MKVIVLKQEDFDRLLAEIDRGPRWGSKGATSSAFTAEQMRFHEDARRFYNYVLRRWIDEVSK